MVGIEKVLMEFYKLSGLQLNVNKSEIHCSEISVEDLRRIVKETGFKIGKLFVRYLGNPLVTKKPIEKDFDPLIRKMKDKVESWGLGIFLMQEGYSWCNLCFKVFKCIGASILLFLYACFFKHVLCGLPRSKLIM